MKNFKRDSYNERNSIYWKFSSVQFIVWCVCVCVQIVSVFISVQQQFLSFKIDFIHIIVFVSVFDADFHHGYVESNRRQRRETTIKEFSIRKFVAQISISSIHLGNGAELKVEQHGSHKVFISIYLSTMKVVDTNNVCIQQQIDG